MSDMKPILTQTEQKDPLWMRVLDRFGFPTLVCFVVSIAVSVIFAQVIMPWWNQYLDHQKQERVESREFIAAQIAEMRQQTAELKKLGKATETERAFESTVLEVHAAQTDILQEIAVDAEATNSKMDQANELMEPVPELRREQVALLKSILAALSQPEP